MNARIQAPASSSTFPIPSVPSTSSPTRRIGLSLPRESCTSQRSFRIRMEASLNCISSKHATAGRFSLGWSTAASSLWGPLIKCSLPVGALLTSSVPGFSAAPFIGDEKVGVLLLNLGGPETLEDVQPFLFNLFADPDIIRLPRLFRSLQKPLAQFISTMRAPKSKEGYASIGGGSPFTF